jgi:DNA polymerase-1
LQKLKGTYTDVLPALVHPETKRIHTNFRQAVAATGRLSSYAPNLQNIPIRTPAGRRIRDAFVPAPGCQLLSADYSQIELRILAHLADDPGLQRAFHEDRDIHQLTASEIFDVRPEQVTGEQRSAAKAINFGLMYGMGAFRLGRDLHISQDEAKSYIARYFERYPAVKSYMDGTVERGRELGYVETLLGRRRYVPELQSKNRMRRTAAERAAINAPVQGTAADLIKLAMLRVADALSEAGLKARMVLQVHDELVFDAPTEEIDALQALVVREMEGVYTLKVPLRVSAATGNNWNEAH